MSRSVAPAGERLKVLRKVETVIGYRFKDRALLDLALTHPSYAHENSPKSIAHYERLEFMGDAVLDLAISRMLFAASPDEGEGYLTRARADLVNKGKLAEIAETLRLGEAIKFGKGEEKSAGQGKPSILAAAFEAVIGAAFLDGGWKTADRILENIFTEHASADEVGMRDPRSLLQEYTQKLFKKTPEYRLLDYTGPAHQRIFRVAASIDGRDLAVAEGASKKEAGRNAARAAYDTLAAEAPSVDDSE